MQRICTLCVPTHSARSGFPPLPILLVISWDLLHGPAGFMDCPAADKDKIKMPELLLYYCAFDLQHPFLHPHLLARASPGFMLYLSHATEIDLLRCSRSTRFFYIDSGFNLSAGSLDFNSLRADESAVCVLYVPPDKLKLKSKE